MVYGEEQTSKTRLKDEDIDVYLTSGEDVLVNANRYKALMIQEYGWRKSMPIQIHIQKIIV